MKKTKNPTETTEYGYLIDVRIKTNKPLSKDKYLMFCDALKNIMQLLDTKTDK